MIARLDRHYPQNASSRRSARPSQAIDRGGFTLTEVVIAIAVIVVLVVMLLPVVTQARRASQSVACLSNLRAISSAFRQYSQDNSNHLPDPGVTEIPWERSLLHYCSPDVFVCPGDQELAPATNSSYDWRDTGIASTTLAGYGLTTSQRPDAVLVFDALPDWHQKSRMNAGVIDGSVRSMTQDECVIDLNTPIRMPSTNK
jgi:prepilin-type N-terminal cleavage/methylation domain-containing protein